MELVLVFIKKKKKKKIVCCDSHLTLITFETDLKFWVFFFFWCLKFDESLLYHLKVYLGFLLIKKNKKFFAQLALIYINFF